MAQPEPKRNTKGQRYHQVIEVGAGDAQQCKDQHEEEESDESNVGLGGGVGELDAVRHHRGDAHPAPAPANQCLRKYSKHLTLE
ncbi:hypothetical protein TYRP_005202 [Tyrophagus putrescentiae]|nr:hypothetical protein TYRP_005202 [Tyrophagus putrescentiae]